MKVTDCIAVFSLDKVGSIPVDTHVWQIACRDLDPSLKTAKSITPTMYNRVGNLLRDMFGHHAGGRTKSFSRQSCRHLRPW